MTRVPAYRKLTPGRAARLIALVMAAVVAVLPVGWMALSSIKSEAEIFDDPLKLVPDAATLENYDALFTQFHFGIATLNSITISVGVVLISVVFGGMAAYGFSRYPFRGASLLLTGLLVTRMVTPAALVVPLYLIMDALGLLNNLFSIIVGIAVLNLPFVVWVLKPFFDALPREIEEAALVDGLSPMRVLWQIAVPLAAPGLVTVALLSFIAGWTDLLFPMSFSTTPEAMPLTAAMLQMQTGYKLYWGPLMAGGVYLALPSLILAFALQRYLVRGLRLSY